MDKKSKIILVLLVITLLSLSSYASLSRFSKGINKEGSIQTTEMEYCKLNEIDNFGECLIRNDSKQELSLALNTIDDRTSRVNFSKTEPYDIYMPKTEYINILDKTSTEGIVTTGDSLTYVIESKLINPFSLDDSEIEKISFNQDTGYYTFTSSLTGDISNIVTTEEDINNNHYKYTCLNTTSNGNCQELYLFTENAYLISESNIFKQGYKYSSDITDSTSMNAGLYKAEDDYTVNNDNYTYYYRGDVNNNWVKYGDSLWRVVRINGNGTIRLIYSGLVSSNHTGNNARINSGKYSNQYWSTLIVPLNDSNNSTIPITYGIGQYGPAYGGYMLSSEKEMVVFPNKTPSNVAGYKLNSFPTYQGFSSTSKDYFFKNFNPEEDCYSGDGTNDDGACVLRCNNLGESPGEDVDCISAIWNTLSTNPDNYSDTAAGVYKSGSTEFDIYQISDTDGGYRYFCASNYGISKHKDSNDAYAACRVVGEILGVVKGNSNYAKVKYYGVISRDEMSLNNNFDSNAKIMLDTWYEENILNKIDEKGNNLESYLADSIFCNDRSSSYSATYPLSSGGASYYYSSYIRNFSSLKPTFKCSNINNDGFTLKTSDTSSTVEASGIGNKMLKYPIALITSDEIFMAGIINSTTNTKNYLNIGVSYFTMSPGYFDANYEKVRMVIVNSEGKLSAVNMSSSYNIRPVINLKSDILYKGGNGTESNPYIIDINN